MDDIEIPRLSRKERVILRQLVAQGESYGLELVNNSEGQLKRGTVYVFLNRMEDRGLVQSKKEQALEPGVAGAPRRIYQIPGHGSRVLAAHEAAALKWAEGLT